MSRFFRAKDKNDNSSNKSTAAKDTEDQRDFQVRDLYKKGVNHMSNDKLNDAIRSFGLKKGMLISIWEIILLLYLLMTWH
jgi:hypothetical protein